MAGWTAPQTWTDVPVSAADFNREVRDNFVAINGYVGKLADESLNLSTTLQNDDALFYALPATGIYTFECFLVVSSAADAAGDIKFGFTFPAATVSFMGHGLDATLASGSAGTFAGAAALVATSGTTVLGFGCSTANNFVYLHGIIANSATGTLQLQWAQNASNANNTTVKSGSHMTVKQVS